MIQFDRHTQWILDHMKYLGANPVDLNDIPGEGEAAFDAYLDALGVVNFSAKELTQVRPDKAELAERLGFKNFLPPKPWWPRLAAQALLAQRVREITKSQIEVRNGWRPQPYNDEVGGAPKSAHVQCCALDLRVASEEAWQKAVSFLMGLYNNRALHMNVGFGYDKKSRFIHAGCFDALPAAVGAYDNSKSRRRWRYDSDGSPISWHTRNLPE